jgi:hypothetical protein
MANLHSQILPKWTLGLSATPYRTDRIKLCFDHVIRDAGIAALIADGYLSQYHHYTIPQHTPEFIAKLLISEAQQWGKSLVFFHRRSECDHLQSLLRAAGVRSDVVTASSDRERQLDDCPDLKTVFCRPSGKGCTIQMAGRVLRTSHRVPFKQVVQCRHTRHPMLRTAMPAEQYLWTDHGWRSISVNRRLDQMTMLARRRVAQAEVRLPNLVAMHRNRNSRAWYAEANQPA